MDGNKLKISRNLKKIIRGSIPEIKRFFTDLDTDTRHRLPVNFCLKLKIDKNGGKSPLEFPLFGRYYETVQPISFIFLEWVLFILNS